MKRERLIRGKHYDEIVSKLNYFCKTIPHDRYEIYRILSNGKSLKLKDLLTRPTQFFASIESLKNGFPLSIRLNITGASIRIKNNARLFYPDQLPYATDGKLSCSAKVGLGSDFRVGNLANEISAKVFFEKHAPTFPIPKMISHDKLNNLWFVEKYISETHRFSNHRKASFFLSNHATDFYGPFFFQMTLERLIEKHDLRLDQIHGVFQEVGASVEGLNRLSTLAGAPTHGDLSPANMMMDEDGRLHVIDWEYFGKGSVAFDLVKLLRIDPRSALSTLSVITTF